MSTSPRTFKQLRQRIEMDQYERRYGLQCWRIFLPRAELVPRIWWLCNCLNPGKNKPYLVWKASGKAIIRFAEGARFNPDSRRGYRDTLADDIPDSDIEGIE